MAGVLVPGSAAPARPSGGRVLREGWARLRARAAFAVVAIWATVAIVAVVAVAPALAWWSAALGHTIDGARLLGSPNVATLAEVLRDSPFGLRTIALAVAAGAAIALVLNPFLAGGLLGALADDSPAPSAGRIARFAADGVRFYGPLLRVLLMVWPVAAAIIGAGAVVVAMPFAGSSTPWLALVAGGAVVAMGTLGATMLVDLARAYLVLSPSRRAGAAIGLGLRQAPRLVLVAVAFGMAFAVAFAALVAVRGRLAGDTWPSILLGLSVQQAYALTRAWLRASMLSSAAVVMEAEIAARHWSAAEAAAAAAIEASAAAASVAVAEERPEVLVVMQGEAGEGGLPGHERGGGGDLTPQIPGRLAAEGDGRRRDADAEEAGPAAPVLTGDRPRDEPPPVA
jgi:hypothetical protein